jgi:SAM-dependent methyltransferase
VSESPIRFDPAAVRESWDFAADAYAEGQAAGTDYYRYEFFGPAQVELCGEVDGKRLVDVGCGNGYFSREMARRGARVTGFDISPRMIEHARRIETAEPLGIDYQVLDAADASACFPADSFDMATSCVALQDMPEIPTALRGIREILRPSGRFIASITHPCTDTPYRAWERDDAGGKKWLRIDRYYERGPLDFTWRGWPYEFTTPSWHAPLEDWFAWILGAGFQLRGLREPTPCAEALAARPDLMDATRVPYFLVLDLIRPI